MSEAHTTRIQQAYGDTGKCVWLAGPRNADRVYAHVDACLREMQTDFRLPIFWTYPQVDSTEDEAYIWRVMETVGDEPRQQARAHSTGARGRASTGQHRQPQARPKSQPKCPAKLARKVAEAAPTAVAAHRAAARIQETRNGVTPFAPQETDATEVLPIRREEDARPETAAGQCVGAVNAHDKQQERRHRTPIHLRRSLPALRTVQRTSCICR